jgi:hypothetical protein
VNNASGRNIWVKDDVDAVLTLWDSPWHDFGLCWILLSLPAYLLMLTNRSPRVIPIVSSFWTIEVLGTMLSSASIQQIGIFQPWFSTLSRPALTSPLWALIASLSEQIRTPYSSLCTRADDKSRYRSRVHAFKVFRNALWTWRPVARRNFDISLRFS